MDWADSQINSAVWVKVLTSTGVPVNVLHDFLPGVCLRGMSPFSGVTQTSLAIRLCLLLCFSSLFLPVVVSGVEVDSGVFFENKIRPVLFQHCFECHGSGAKELKGGLRLDSREGMLRGGDSGPSVVPGDVVNSLLLRAVRHQAGELEMPWRKPKLSEQNLADLEFWIKTGAHFPSSKAPGIEKAHWSFQPVRPSALLGRRSSWSRTPVDPFIESRLVADGHRPSPEADRRTLLRRASYDLTGLPPAAGEIEWFERD